MGMYGPGLRKAYAFYAFHVRGFIFRSWGALAQDMSAARRGKGSG
jgi:hypothetical protein